MMASIAAQMARELIPAGRRGSMLGSAAVGRLRLPKGGQAAEDLLDARALASAGLAALVSLPVLILGTFALGVPLAAPAILALGYLALAQAVAARRPRRVAAWSLAVFLGLVGWAALFPLFGGEARSWSGLAALAIAPLFAAAPALARAILTGRSGGPQAWALERAGCLDRLAPNEAVLFIDAHGSLIAATRAALNLLGIQGHAAAGGASGLFDRRDHSALLKALKECRSAAAPVEIALRPAMGSAPRPTLMANIQADTHGVVVIRLRAAEQNTPAEGPRDKDRAVASLCQALEPPSAAAGCWDLQEAVSFAVRRVGARAKASGVTLLCEGDSEVLAQCDRRDCRRIAHSLIEAVVAQCSAGGLVRVSARNLRGAVLLRVSARRGAGDLDWALDLAALGEMIDQAGGTLVAERSVEVESFSVRLASAERRLAGGPDAGVGA
jgi:hypothetical protein